MLQKRHFLLPNFSVDRVTRLGEFSPIGWLLTLGNFLEVAQIFWVLFPRKKWCTY
jgi:hypothetical protein